MGGQRWWVAHAGALGGRRNARLSYLFPKALAVHCKLPGSAGAFAMLTQLVVNGIMGPSWRHRVPVGTPLSH